MQMTRALGGIDLLEEAQFPHPLKLRKSPELNKQTGESNIKWMEETRLVWWKPQHAHPLERQGKSVLKLEARHD